MRSLHSIHRASQCHAIHAGCRRQTSLASLCAMLLAALLCGPWGGVAAQYPNRPVKVIVPYGAGTSTDLLARAVGEPLAKKFGQPILVDNRVGANSTIGTELVARSPNDGYTLLFGTNAGLAASPAGLWRNIGYDQIRDFAPISLVASIYHILVINPALPAQNLQQLVAAIKASPGKYNYASANTAGFVYMEMFKKLTGTNVVNVPYKSSPQATTDLISGRIHLMFIDPATGVPKIRAGQVRGVASVLRRSPLLPDLPTFAESGVDGIADASGWYAYYAPAGTPQPIIGSLNREIVGILKTPSTRDWIVNNGYNVVGSTPAELETYTRKQIEFWTQLIKEMDIEPAG